MAYHYQNEPVRYLDASPVAQPYRATAAVAQQYQAATPVGQPYQTAAAVTQQYLAHPAVAQPYQVAAPVGQQYQVAAPVGQPYQAAAPVGQPYQAAVPVGQPYQAAAPVGRPYPAHPETGRMAQDYTSDGSSGPVGGFQGGRGLQWGSGAVGLQGSSGASGFQGSSGPIGGLQGSSGAGSFQGGSGPGGGFQGSSWSGGDLQWSRGAVGFKGSGGGPSGGLQGSSGQGSGFQDSSEPDGGLQGSSDPGGGLPWGSGAVGFKGSDGSSSGYQGNSGPGSSFQGNSRRGSFKGNSGPSGDLQWGSGAGDFPNACSNCGGFSHMACDCPSERRSGVSKQNQSRTRPSSTNSLYSAESKLLSSALPLTEMTTEERQLYEMHRHTQERMAKELHHNKPPVSVSKQKRSMLSSQHQNIPRHTSINSRSSLESRSRPAAKPRKLLPDEPRTINIPQRSRNKGLGISILAGQDGIFVSHVVENSPAARNGLVIGDQILEFSGFPFQNETEESARDLINSGNEAIEMLVQFKPYSGSTVFVKDVDPNVREEDLRVIFPNALKIRISCYRRNKERCMAFIDFLTTEEAEAAVRTKQGTKLWGMEMDLQFSRRRQTDTTARPDAGFPISEKCFRCGESGHLARECKSEGVARQNEGRTGAGGFKSACFKCDEIGHKAHQCTSEGISGGHSTVFVDNVDVNVTEADIRVIFPNALHIRIVSHGRNSITGKCFAFIDFLTTVEAGEAVRTKQGTKLEGKELHLQISRRKGDSTALDRDGSAVYVKDVDPDVTEDDIRVIFPNALNIQIKPSQRYKERCFVFIEFSTTEEAAEAVRTKQGTKLRGEELDLQISIKRLRDSTAPPEGGFRISSGGRFTVYMENICKRVQKDDVSQLFPNALQIRYRPGNGFAYIEFSTTEEAEEEIRTKQGTKLAGSKIKLDFARIHKVTTKGHSSVFVKTFENTVTEGDVRQLFPNVSRIRLNPEKGFAFLDFLTTEEAEETVRTMQGTAFAGQELALEMCTKVDKRGGRARRLREERRRLHDLQVDGQSSRSGSGSQMDTLRSAVNSITGNVLERLQGIMPSSEKENPEIDDTSPTSHSRRSGQRSQNEYDSIERAGREDGDFDVRIEDRDRDIRDRWSDRDRDIRDKWSDRDRAIRDRGSDRDRNIRDRQSDRDRDIRDRGSDRDRDIRDRGSDKDRDIRDRGSDRDRDIRDRGSDRDRDIRDRGSDRDRDRRDRGSDRDRDIRDRGSDRDRDIRDRGSDRDRDIRDRGSDRDRDIRDRGSDRDRDIRDRLSDGEHYARDNGDWGEGGRQRWEEYDRDGRGKRDLYDDMERWEGEDRHFAKRHSGSQEDLPGHFSRSLTKETAMLKPRKPRPGETRILDIRKRSDTDVVGFRIAQGVQGGIMVSFVGENSLAENSGIIVGDEILEICGNDFRNMTKESAVKVILSCHNEYEMVVQFNPDNLPGGPPTNGSQIPESSGPMQKPLQQDTNTIFVSKLPKQTSEGDLIAMFPKATNITVNRRKNGKCNGTAIIYFESDDMAAAHEAIKNYNETEFGGRGISVMFYAPIKRENAALPAPRPLMESPPRRSASSSRPLRTMSPEEAVEDRPVHDRPVHERQVHDRPVHDRPVHEREVHDRPVHDRPVHDRPVHDRLATDSDPWRCVPHLGETRIKKFVKRSTTESIGFQIEALYEGGITVSNVVENSLAANTGIFVGDQIMMFCRVPLEYATKESAARVMLSCQECLEFEIIVQYNPDKRICLPDEAMDSLEDNRSRPELQPPVHMPEFAGKPELQPPVHMPEFAVPMPEFAVPMTEFAVPMPEFTVPMPEFAVPTYSRPPAPPNDEQSFNALMNVIAMWESDDSHDEKYWIDKMASIISRRSLEFEQRLTEQQHETSSFSFLLPCDRNYAFYKSVLPKHRIAAELFAMAHELEDIKSVSPHDKMALIDQIGYIIIQQTPEFVYTFATNQRKNPAFSFMFPGDENYDIYTSALTKHRLAMNSIALTPVLVDIQPNRPYGVPQGIQINAHPGGSSVAPGIQTLTMANSAASAPMVASAGMTIVQYGQGPNRQQYLPGGVPAKKKRKRRRKTPPPPQSEHTQAKQSHQDNRISTTSLSQSAAMDLMDGGQADRDEAWKCVCGNLNEAKRTYCLSCNKINMTSKADPPLMKQSMESSTSKPLTPVNYQSVQLELSDMKDQVAKCATDKDGAWFILSRLRTATPNEIKSIFKEVHTAAAYLIIHPVGLSVVQEVFKLGSEEARLMSNCLRGQMRVYSCNVNASQVIHAVLDLVPEIIQFKLIRELDGHLLQCMQNEYGSRVLQKALECMNPGYLQSTVDIIKKQVCNLGTNAHAYKVIESAIQYGNSDQKTSIIDKISESFEKLVCNENGSRVIQAAIDYGSTEDQSRINTQILDYLVTLTPEKFATASELMVECEAKGLPTMKLHDLLKHISAFSQHQNAAQKTDESWKL